ncbi:hypothetical protein VKT23_006247 [Stygiomarasmius scandens]|uniref:Uncharacterized protein n=1 Tax=Marasmiellus scandens TaxID=2682957 RepID=A0ABR1JPR7_9AGAR
MSKYQALLLVGLVVVANVQSAPVDSDNSTLIYPRVGSGPQWPRPSTIRASQHPSANQHPGLFHGTANLQVARMIFQQGLDASDLAGDFNPGEQNSLDGVGGAAYLTDSLIAAVQYVCHGHEGKKNGVTHAHVVRFQLAGTGSGVQRFEEKDGTWQYFTNTNLGAGWNALRGGPNHGYYVWAQQVFGNSIIEGPMDAPDDEDVTPNFWQYAVVDPVALMTDLIPVALYENIPCNKVAKGERLTDATYLAGQYTGSKASSKFKSLLKSLGVSESTGSSSQAESSAQGAKSGKKGKKGK